MDFSCESASSRFTSRLVWRCARWRALSSIACSRSDSWDMRCVSGSFKRRTRRPSKKTAWQQHKQRCCFYLILFFYFAGTQVDTLHCSLHVLYASATSRLSLTPFAVHVSLCIDLQKTTQSSCCTSYCLLMRCLIVVMLGQISLPAFKESECRQSGFETD